MNMLQRARNALSHEPETPKLNARFFIVPPTLKEPEKHDAMTDEQISSAFANAAKENSAMNEPATTFTESYIDNSGKHRSTLLAEREHIELEQSDADAEHKAQLDRLNDEISTRKDAHSDVTKENAERIADIDKVIGAIDAALKALQPATPVAEVDHAAERRGGKAEKPTIVRKLHGDEFPAEVYYKDGNFYAVSGHGMGQGFYAKWRDRASEFPTTPEAAMIPPVSGT